MTSVFLKIGHFCGETVQGIGIFLDWNDMHFSAFQNLENGQFSGFWYGLSLKIAIF